MKTKLLSKLFTLIIIFIITDNLIVFGQEASPSSDVNKEEITEKIKERLEKVDEKTVLGETSDSQKTYSHFGIITEIAKTYLILETSQKKRVEIKFDPETELSLYLGNNKKNQIIESDEIESGWFAIAMGTDYYENSLTALRISLSENYTPPPNKKTIIGKVKEIEETSLLLTNGQETTISIPDKFDLQIKGVKKPNFEDISLNDKIVAIAEITQNDDNETVYELKSLFVIPSLNNPKAADNTVNESTSSAEATDSAKTE